MLSFDIETTGLSAINGCKITVICTEDFHTRTKKAYEFARHAGDEQKLKELREEVLRDFEAAESLCAFNGAKFDLPFMAVALDISYEQVRRWHDKLTDIFQFCKDKYLHTFSLNKLCEANMIPVKISSGLAAIKMAADGNFAELLEYCQYDVSILNILYQKRHIMNPRNNAMMDLALWTKPYVYPHAAEETPLQKAKMALDAENALMAARRVGKNCTTDSLDTDTQPAPAKRARLELHEMLEDASDQSSSGSDTQQAAHMQTDQENDPGDGPGHDGV